MRRVWSSAREALGRDAAPGEDHAGRGLTDEEPAGAGVAAHPL